ncbi:MAG: SDR family NAD(P)-dependent oxidoreductase [Nitrospiraceae bacterium]|nr:SDR family NAD(P)-dependent oxidoreductase [Nitrospiraceae bacterium]
MDSRVVLVTGSSRGLGKTIALRFGSAGGRIAVHYREREKEARSTEKAIVASGGEAACFRCDVTDFLQVRRLAEQVMGRWGRIDVVVNNAGITQDGLAIRLSEEDWDCVVGTNLSGPFAVIQAVAAPMMKQGDGSIINIASISGLQGRQGQANYSAAKAGLIGLTKASARELGRFNIRINAVLPGFLATDMGQTVEPGMRERIMADHVLGRTSEAGEVAEFIYRLSLMRNVSGQVFNIDNRIL